MVGEREKGVKDDFQSFASDKGWTMVPLNELGIMA